MSFYDSASLAFLPSGGAGKDGKAYSIKPVPEYGNELITNGGFDTDSDWVKVSSTISGGTGNLNGTGVTSLLYQSNVLTQNKKYYLTFTISNYNGLGQLEVINNDGTVYYLATSNGNISIEFTHSIANQNFLFRARNSAIASIDNVSVKEVIVDGDFTFSRGSNLTATRVDSNGLIEKGRENLLLQSNQFDTTWTTSNASVTSGQSGYDGSSDAWLLEATGTSSTRVQQTISSDSVQTISVYAKKGTSDYFQIRLTGSTTAFAFFDLANGTLGTLSNQVDASITSVGNGWYRCSLVRTGAATSARIYVTGNNTTSVSVGDNIYIQDAQLEIGLTSTEYIESGATTGLAGLLEDSPRFDYSGGASCPSLLLEPSRTNVWKYTEYLSYSFSQIVATTITQNTTETLSPEGLYNATKLEGIGSWIFKDFLAGTDTGTWTVSCWVKAVNPSSNNTFRLSVSGNNFSSNLTATNDWQRFYFSVTNGGATAAGLQRDTSANDADLYVYGLQVEEGSYPTSYIPNHSGGSVTREADSMQSDTSSFNITNEFTLFIDTNGALVDGTSLNQMDDLRWYTQSTNRYRFYKSSNAIFISNNIQVDDRTKIALKITATECKTFVDGVLDSTISLTTPFASFDSISRDMETKVKEELNQILLFPTALSDTDLEILTGTSYESFAAMATALNYTTYE